MADIYISAIEGSCIGIGSGLVKTNENIKVYNIQSNTKHIEEIRALFHSLNISFKTKRAHDAREFFAIYKEYARKANQQYTEQFNELTSMFLKSIYQIVDHYENEEEKSK